MKILTTMLIYFVVPFIFSQLALGGSIDSPKITACEAYENIELLKISSRPSVQTNFICDHVLYPSTEEGNVTYLKKRDETMIRKEDVPSQNGTQKPKSKLRTIFLVVAIIVGAIGLFLFWYITGLARGFSNS